MYDRARFATVVLTVVQLLALSCPLECSVVFKSLRPALRHDFVILQKLFRLIFQLLKFPVT